jgi:diguanylate cyclase (GGDEF)-like protein
MTKPAEILILSRNPERARHWTRVLSGRDARLWQDVSQVPPGVTIELIVTDGPLTEDRLASEHVRACLAGGEIEVVKIGQREESGVCLPPDAAASELRLACRLLAQCVRLRRECNRGREERETLRRLALTDPLTGLPNRRAWDAKLLELGTDAARQPDRVRLALLDLDHFKLVNSRFGHVAGDDLLRFIGRRLAELVTAPNFAARLGGDEFALALAGPRPADLMAEIEAIRLGACQQAPTEITASVGFAVDDPPTDAVESLLVAADRALRHAKLTGRDRSVLAVAPNERFADAIEDQEIDRDT